MTDAVTTDETLDWPEKPVVAAFFAVELIVSTVRIVNIQLLMSNSIPRKSENASKRLLAEFGQFNW
ncbi:hypothetical protein CW740_07025 [Kangiella profundi]|uniref:Uncharacterized protein n=1 Tax=Kangiella profundi TaxID=1561924 RepID=A0A2K9AN14_9GAMM|nr:hypothetical protein CW740_07025 [Kangiella profundi]GGF02244.1 hypothetical protein GCM10011356_14900 [Kangiella profundi]